LPSHDPVANLHIRGDKNMAGCLDKLCKQSSRRRGVAVQVAMQTPPPSRAPPSRQSTVQWDFADEHDGDDGEVENDEDDDDDDDDDNGEGFSPVIGSSSTRKRRLLDNNHHPSVSSSIYQQ
jgi:hypothetical protein